MVVDLYESILQDLSRILSIPPLHPDGNNSCLIILMNGLQIQLEMDKQNDFLYFGSDLGTLPEGRYRENLFREALKANALPLPRYGAFAFSSKTGHLIFFERFRARELNSSRISDFIGHFSEKAFQWKEAITRGEVPVVQVQRPTSSMFGLR